MSTSTNGQICYGILLEEGIELPWDAEPYNGDLEGWWITAIHGFKHSFELYTEDGDGYLGGIEPSEKDIDTYWHEKFDFSNAHPCPVELFNVCSGDYPIYILAIQAVYGLVAYRGAPEAFNPASLVATEADRRMLLDFCKTHNIEIDDAEPKWYLSSCWG